MLQTASICQGGFLNHRWEASMSEVSMVGLDLAKHVFQVHGANGVGLIEQLEHEDLIEVKLSDGRRLTTKTHGASGISVGDRLAVALDPAAVHVFDAAGRRLDR
jgi:ABC-type sugar transport system ATPase subunit